MSRRTSLVLSLALLAILLIARFTIESELVRWGLFGMGLFAAYVGSKQRLCRVKWSLYVASAFLVTVAGTRIVAIEVQTVEGTTVHVGRYVWSLGNSGPPRNEMGQ